MFFYCIYPHVITNKLKYQRKYDICKNVVKERISFYELLITHNNP